MSYHKSIIIRSVKSKKFMFTIVIIVLSMAFSLISILGDGIEYFFNNDYIRMFLQGYNSDTALLPAVSSLIATIPLASQYVENRKSGYAKYVLSRMDKKKYFNSIFITNSIMSFVAFALGMALFLIILFVFFNKNVDMEYYYGITKFTIYKSIARISPLLYVVVIILHCSLVSVMYSSLGLAFSYFIKNKFVAWVSPFIVSTLASLFAIFIGITKLEPMAIFDVSRVTNASILFSFSYVMIVIVLSYFIAYKKYMRDIKNDEGI